MLSVVDFEFLDHEKGPVGLDVFLEPPHIAIFHLKDSQFLDLPQKYDEIFAVVGEVEVGVLDWVAVCRFLGDDNLTDDLDLLEVLVRL